MSEKFIKNEQFNFIIKQIDLIKDNTKKHVPQTVLKATIDLANAKILDLFPNASLDQMKFLDITELKTDDAYEEYLQQISAYLLPFPKITEQQLKKMFAKNKKLKLPDLSILDYNQLTYLGWNDLRSNKKYMVYDLEGKMIGIEGKLTLVRNPNYCSICNCFGEVSYFSTITKAKKTKNPDYYKSIGNLICSDSSECNKKITNVNYLKTFLNDSLGM